MANILSTSQVVQKNIDFYKSAQPSLDTKIGSVVRDLFIDGPSLRLGELYNELSKVASVQSIANSVGEDLDKQASNYSVTRGQAGKSTGYILLTFNSILSDITVPSGSFAYSKNGLAFRILTGFVISSSNDSQYKALAITYKSDFDIVGITDNYAVQTMVECTVAGTAGNISKYSIASCSIPGISNVVNVKPFAGGSSTENDSSFKNNIMAVFSGSNNGTELGYQNTIIANSAVLDAVIIGPGDSLMVRDNTILKKDSNGDLVLDANGEPIIVSAGTGGKVDCFAYGRRLTENTDSYIYTDKSGKNDPTNVANDYVIGQIASDAGKTITKKRLDNIQSGNLPNQPVEEIVEVIGSSSGSFSQAVIDENGNSIGNFILAKDTGTYTGSCFGFDKLHWIKNYISTTENLSKNTFNGQEQLTYSDSLKITNLNRTINVVNENSTVVSTNRSEIILSHTPIRNINKVLNFTTGERYIVANRNPSGNIGDLNYIGKIIISGNNLPLVSDILQVDYEWDYSHDVFLDFDSFTMNDNPRTAIDSIDWGYGNAIRRENELVEIDYTVKTQHQITSVISINKVSKHSTSVVELNTSGVGGAGFVINGLANNILNIVSVKRSNGDGAELYNTKLKNGSFDGNKILLPTDTPAVISDPVIVVYNAFDVYTINGTSGNFKDNTIYLPQAAYSIIAVNDTLEVNYIANISELLPSTNLTSLPISSYYNGFQTNVAGGVSIGVQPVTNIYAGSYILSNLRKTPSKLGINVSGITSTGVIAIKGITSKLIKDVVFQSTTAGLKIDLSLAIKKSLGLDASADLPTNVKISRLISLEKVETNSNTNVVISTLYSFDITGYGLLNNSFALNESVINTTINNYQASLPSTTNNVLNSLFVGDTLRCSFYITIGTIIDFDSESISFSTNGTLYTNKDFAYITNISISSGFKSSNILAGAISIFTLSQPPVGTRYKTKYNYLAPKNGERIYVRYNSNSLINELTFALEKKRFITADVLVKSASGVLIDIYAAITVTKEFAKTAYLVQQNVADKIASYINNLGLGKYLNQSDIVNVAYQVAGLDSIQIVRFNKSTKEGNVSVIRSLRTQYLQANNIQISL